MRARTGCSHARKCSAARVKDNCHLSPRAALTLPIFPHPLPTHTQQQQQLTKEITHARVDVTEMRNAFPLFPTWKSTVCRSARARTANLIRREFASVQRRALTVCSLAVRDAIGKGCERELNSGPPVSLLAAVCGRRVGASEGAMRNA